MMFVWWFCYTLVVLFEVLTNGMTIPAWEIVFYVVCCSIGILNMAIIAAPNKEHSDATTWHVRNTHSLEDGTPIVVKYGILFYRGGTIGSFWRVLREVDGCNVWILKALWLVVLYWYNRLPRKLDMPKGEYSVEWVDNYEQHFSNQEISKISTRNSS